MSILTSNSIFHPSGLFKPECFYHYYYFVISQKRFFMKFWIFTQIALVVLWLVVTSEEIIIVAGGFNKGQILKSTEMLRYGEWEAGPNLPKKLYGHSVIGFEKDLYVLGGNSGFWYEKAIHRLRCSNADCSWITMKASLKVRRQYFVAIPMNTSQVTCISLLPED